MRNKLFNDLATCANLSGHGDILGHREIETTLANDKDGNQRQIVLDKAIDIAPEGIANTISKIYNTFFSKSNAKFWNHRINCFEYKYDVDWYLMISYLYMVNEDRDANARAFNTVGDACAVLAQMDVESIENEEGFQQYMAMVNKLSKGGNEFVKENIKVDIS